LLAAGKLNCNFLLHDAPLLSSSCRLWKLVAAPLFQRAGMQIRRGTMSAGELQVIFGCH